MNLTRRVVLCLAVLGSVFFVLGCRPASAAVEKGSFMNVYFNDPYADKRDTTLQQLIVDEIDAAAERVLVATYNFTDREVAEAMISAVERGLEVRAVIHGENADKATVRDMADAGVEIYEANGAGLMHSKFIVIDDDRSISGSANMTPSSFFYDNNFMILIQSREANAIFAAEFNEMFFDNLLGANSPVSAAPGIIELADGTKFLLRFAPEDEVSGGLLTAINGAKEKIRMLAYSFTEDNLGKALNQQFRNGVDVTVIFEADKAYSDKGGEAGFLKDQGVKVFLDGSTDALMHEKVLIIDDSFVAAGSYNFTRSADRFNDEQILFISSTEITSFFIEEFEKILAEAK